MAIPAVMIQGLGMQASDWPGTLIAALAGDRRLIIFDNRDAGLSQLFGVATDQTLVPSTFPDHRPWPHPVAYTLFDMANDVVLLMNALNIGRVHLVGFSMGGMIAQITAAYHPSRVASLVGLMTSAGQPWIDSTAAADHMLRRSILFEHDEERLLEMWLEAEEIYAGPMSLPDWDTRRLALAQSVARAYRPAGIWRQACAMRASDDRQALLRTVTAPSLMIHGEEDPVIALRQALEARRLMPQTDFQVLGGTGHALTEENSTPLAASIKSFWAETEESSASKSSIGHLS
ncbi:MAG: alpha/beta hydrolase [Rhodospirillaceae bacterium]|nr:alpha/beta hydrolase [Rhodospirillaceae bacterium]